MRKGIMSQVESFYRGQTLLGEGFTSTEIPRLGILHPLSHFCLHNKTGLLGMKPGLKEGK